MKRPTIVPSMVVLAFALSSCASAENAQTVASPFAGPGPSGIEGAVELAQSQRAAGNFDGATATLSQLVLVAPDDPRVLAEYGKTLVDRGESADALAFLQRAIELNPGEWSFYSAQGVALAQSGNFHAAQIAFGRALTLKPDDPVVLNNFALAHLQAGNLEQAEALLLRASMGGLSVPKIAQNLALVRQLRAAEQPGTPLPVIDNPPIAPVEAIEPAPNALPTTPDEVIETAAVITPQTPDEIVELAADIPLATPDEVVELAANNPPVSPSEAIEVETPAIADATPVQIPAESMEGANTEPVRMPEPVLDIAENSVASPTLITPALDLDDAAENSLAELAPQTEEPRVQIEVIEKVELEEVEAAPAIVESDIWMPSSGPIYLQIGAFASEENAGRLFEKLETLDPQITLTAAGERTLHRVIVGPYADREETRSALTSLGEFGIDDVQVMSRLPGDVQRRDDIANTDPADALADDTASEPSELPDAAPSLRFSETL